jgi:hypothetical protein
LRFVFVSASSLAHPLSLSFFLSFLSDSLFIQRSRGVAADVQMPSASQLREPLLRELLLLLKESVLREPLLRELLLLLLKELLLKELLLRELLLREPLLIELLLLLLKESLLRELLLLLWSVTLRMTERGR